jgi:hypothetical protein
MGYAESAFALIRLTKDRCRVVASGSLIELSGQALDAMILEETVARCRNGRSSWAPAATAPQWLARRVRRRSGITLAQAKTATVVLDSK